MNAGVVVVVVVVHEDVVEACTECGATVVANNRTIDNNDHANVERLMVVVAVRKQCDNDDGMLVRLSLSEWLWLSLTAMAAQYDPVQQSHAGTPEAWSSHAQLTPHQSKEHPYRFRIRNALRIVCIHKLI